MPKKPTHDKSEYRAQKVATETVERNRRERGQGESEDSFLAKKSVAFIAGILILFGLYLSSLYNYLLFHSLAEFFSIVVAWAIFILAWNSRRIMDNNYLLFIGIAYLFIGTLDLVHTLGYRGMGIFHRYATNLPTQLWIASRYMESLSLLIAPLFLARRLRADLVLMIYALVTALVLGSVFYWHIFPTCFVEGIGLTPFKKISEYIISIILLGAITLLFQKRKEFDERVFRLLVAAMVITIAAELAFTFYISAYGFSNLVGHYFKIISFYLIYKAIIETGLTRPYDLLFRNLKQSEEALQESEERFRTVADFTHDWEFWVAPDGHHIYVSPSCERITGYGPEEFVNDPELLQKIVHPDDHSTIVNHLGEEQGLEKLPSLDYRIITRSGEVRWINHVCQAVYDADGTYLGRRGSNRDITKSKQMEEEVLKAKKLESLGVLAGGIAHEFNNALMGILGNIELLKMDLPEDEGTDKYFDPMKSSGHRMSRLNDQLLAYAQGGKYQPKNLKLDDFVIQTLSILQHDLSPTVKVERRFPKDISYIKADYAQMQMVLSAILANSNEAIENEGLIRITAENKDIDEDFTKQHPGLKPDSPYVCLTIEDDGKGMDEETKDGIFEPFSPQSFRVVEWGWPLCMELSRIMMDGSLWTLNWRKALWFEFTFLPLR